MVQHIEVPEPTKVEQGIALVSDMTDEELNRLVDYIRGEYKERANARNRKARATLQVKDKVMFAGKMKPQYLTGLTGEIVEIRQTRMVVLLDRGPTKKFTNGRVVANPSSLKKIG